METFSPIPGSIPYLLTKLTSIPHIQVDQVKEKPRHNRAPLARKPSQENKLPRSCQQFEQRVNANDTPAISSRATFTFNFRENDARSGPVILPQNFMGTHRTRGLGSATLKTIQSNSSIRFNPDGSDGIPPRPSDRSARKSLLLRLGSRPIGNDLYAARSRFRLC